MSMVWPVAALAASAVALMLPARVRLAAPAVPGPAPVRADVMLRYRPLWCLLAGVGAAVFVAGPAGWVAGPLAAAVAWVVVGRAEPAVVRRRRDAVRRDLPHVVTLFAAALRAGADPAVAIAVVADALPGAATERLREVAARLALGSDPEQVWLALTGSSTEDTGLARLGRTMARASVSGAPVVATVERLADELSRAARADVEDRARAVGVKAAVPLGLCLLPAFVLIGIVPLVGGLLTGLGL